jgi:membrane associated rhomboid family serine protease
MTGRRTLALFLLALMAVAYSVVALMAATTGFYSTGASDLVLAGASGVVAAAVPAIIGAALFAALRLNASQQVITGLFAVWFAMALVSGVLVHWYWAAALLINGAVPYLRLRPALRARPQAS